MVRKNRHAPENDQNQGLPLFFQNPSPITLERHGNAGLNDQSGVSFARMTNSIPINLTEFAEIARSYPIVFTAAEDPTPIALCGLESENYFIDDKGQWKSAIYIPAYVRKYPFALLESPDKAQWILCVDEAAEEFVPVNPTHRFYEKGEATALSQRALDFCSAFQQHFKITQDFCYALQSQGLLADRVSTLKLNDGTSINLRGFRAIDEEKYQQLPDDIFLEWRKLGWTTMIDAVLLSAVNWKYIAEMAADHKAAA